MKPFFLNLASFCGAVVRMLILGGPQIVGHLFLFILEQVSKAPLGTGETAEQLGIQFPAFRSITYNFL